MLNNEKITKIIARRYIWLPFLMGVLLGIVCFVVFTGYDRMKIEKIADETLDFMQDRVKKYDDYKNNDKVKSLYRLADKTLELDQRLEERCRSGRAGRTLYERSEIRWCSAYRRKSELCVSGRRCWKDGYILAGTDE